MADKNDKNIYIHNVIGGESGKALIDCFFVRQGNTYTFFDSDGTEKASDIKVGEDFSVQLDRVPDVNWTLSITNPVGPDKLLGRWNDSRDPALAEGSYQAEAGGSGDPEEPNAASAGSYS
jgi:hypothetical protein